MLISSLLAFSDPLDEGDGGRKACDAVETGARTVREEETLPYQICQLTAPIQRWVPVIRWLLRLS